MRGYPTDIMNVSPIYSLESFHDMTTMKTSQNQNVTSDFLQSVTTENTSQSYHQETESDLPYTESAINIMMRYYIWAILVFGFPGNLFSFVTIMNMSRLKSSTFYVAALAAVDNICLILKTIFMELRYHPQAFTSAGCKVICFFGLMTAAYSNWILVAIASERFMAVRFPLKVASMWTLRRAVMLTMTVLIILSIIHLHIFWTMDNAKYGCEYIPEYSHFTATYWYWMSASLYAFIPCTVLIFFNFLIVHRIQQSSKLRRRLTSDGDILPSLFSAMPAKRPASVGHDSHITMMLISVTIVFVILTIPRCVFMLFIHDGGPETNDVTRQLLDVITSFFADSNHAINFYLYFLAAKQFRYHFFKLFYRQERPSSTGTQTRRSTLVKYDERETKN